MAQNKDLILRSGVGIYHRATLRADRLAASQGYGSRRRFDRQEIALPAFFLRDKLL
jgi:hypothetical protein